MGLEKELAKANRQLLKVKIVHRKSRVARHPGSLSFRATLPPKPGESDKRKKQRLLATGHPGTLTGVKKVLPRAKYLDAQLIEGTFAWVDWDLSIAEKLRPKTIGYWVRQYLEIKLELVSKATLRDSYETPLLRLPEGESLSDEICRKIIREQTQGKPSQRVKFIRAYSQLCKLAGVDHELSNLYPPKQQQIKPVNPHELPSDSEIVEIWKGIKRQDMQIYFARLACYGLRPHEAVVCSIDENSQECNVPGQTKTGPRMVLPLPKEWFDLMKPYQYVEANVQGKTLHMVGKPVVQWFTQHMPFKAYYLRHRWACRCLELNMPTGTAAKFMGHSINVHTQTYQQAISKTELLKAWESL